MGNCRAGQNVVEGSSIRGVKHTMSGIVQSICVNQKSIIGHCRRQQNWAEEIRVRIP